MSNRVFAVLAVVLLAIVAGTLTAQAFNKKPSISVIGHCRSAANGGGLKIVAHGFSPQSIFLFKLRRPDGKAEFPPAMWVDKNGDATVPFKCSVGPDGVNPEPGGTYRFSFLEYSSSGNQAQGKFEVGR